MRVHPVRAPRALATALVAGIAAAALAVVPAQAQDLPLLLRDSFPLGSGGGNALCQVQSRAADVANKTPFDRTWAVVCRDSALPVGYVFALRDEDGDATRRLADRRGSRMSCSAGLTDRGFAPEYGASMGQLCQLNEPRLDYEHASIERGKTTYYVEGFTAYHGAMDLALRSIIAGRAIDEPIEVATTSIDDTEAYARIQALSLDPATALAEGYRRNNSGDYADAAAYFETLDQRLAGDGGSGVDRVEFLVNAALQRSNLGQFAEADRLFATADSLPAGSGVIERMRRNYEAIHLLNQEKYEGALARLGQPLKATAAMGSDTLRASGELTPALVKRVNLGDGGTSALGLIDDLKLTDDERAAILDAQALHLRGSALRLLGRNDEARGVLRQGLQSAMSVRNGRVVSIVKMRAQMITELADIDESEGKFDSAEGLLRSALDIVGVQYPESRSFAAGQARLAAFLTRRGKNDEALSLYRDVVGRSVERRNALSGLSRQMAPYFDLLIAREASDPAARADFFAASQILVRPGVAETQAVLSRELSGGSDEAARLFRQSVSLTRSIEKARMQLAALARLEDAAGRKDEIAALSQQIADLEQQEQATVIKLSDFARYRVVSQRAISQDELVQGLQPGEVYAKMAVLGPDVFVYFASKDRTLGYRAAITSGELTTAMQSMRDSISKYDGQQYVTTPFDVEAARKIYLALFGPVDADLAAARHLIFEPDGAMLQLPPNLLVADEASMKAYIAQADSPEGDPFDMTMVNWLGKDKVVSTSVSARSFMDSRKQPLSKAKEAYLGLGRNAVVTKAAASTGSRSAGTGGNGCDWPLAAWNRPISDEELLKARQLLTGEGTDLMTGAAFTDSAIKARGDLADFRILHFATHGLVTPPQPTCPTRPALLTSFGQGDSDGLLTFAEIFDLKLDADMVILSACDTAGQADVTATREAGVATGGGAALEGLVRAFIGAGGRSVLASHWPAPDDFNATGRLINGLFAAPPGTSSGEALLAAEQALMADPNTSHPYYWSGFSVIGDAAKPLLRSLNMAQAPVPSAGGL